MHRDGSATLRLQSASRRTTAADELLNNMSGHLNLHEAIHPLLQQRQCCPDRYRVAYDLHDALLSRSLHVHGRSLTLGLDVANDGPIAPDNSRCRSARQAELLVGVALLQQCLCRTHRSTLAKDLDNRRIPACVHMQGRATVLLQLPYGGPALANDSPSHALWNLNLAASQRSQNSLCRRHLFQRADHLGARAVDGNLNAQGISASLCKRFAGACAARPSIHDGHSQDPQADLLSQQVVQLPTRRSHQRRHRLVVRTKLSILSPQ
jgi:hypothetical protein